MPRLARLDTPGVLHHIIIRGIERRLIFEDDENRGDEKLNRRYELKSRGYDLREVEKRVMEVLGVERETIYTKGRRRIEAEAKGLLCYWAVRDLEMKGTELAKRLGMSQPAVGYAVRRGEEIANQKGWTLEG